MSWTPDSSLRELRGVFRLWEEVLSHSYLYCLYGLRKYVNDLAKVKVVYF